MNNPTLLDRFDVATMALSRIRLLAGIQSHNQLEPEEVSLLCDIIYETAEKACREL